MREYTGLLFIGDPHLASRTPGYRKDDYPNRILRKLDWCLEYADREKLLPCILGDLFEKPRDNATWLIGDLCSLLVGREVIAIYGNHDCRENSLGDDDSLSVLVKAKLLRLVGERTAWQGRINGQDVIVGGTAWGEHPPTFTDIFWDGVSNKTLVFWMMHHDIRVPGYEAIGNLDTYELPGIHVVVNGHIHSRSEPVRRGRTLWVNPGNIARIKRTSKDHVPAVLRTDVEGLNYTFTYVEVPHEPFGEVFHDDVRLQPAERDESAFVRGLAELKSRRTASGEGLKKFLDENVHQYEPAVADEIMKLAKEVLEVV